MLLHYGLWICSEILGFLSLILIMVGGNLPPTIGSFIAGTVALLLGTLAFFKEPYFQFIEHRSWLVGPVVGGLFALATLYRITIDTLGEDYTGIIMLVYIVVVAAIIVLMKYFQKPGEQSHKESNNSQKEEVQTVRQIILEPVPSGDWRCACGRTHAAYVSSCSCGLGKKEGKVNDISNS